MDSSVILATLVGFIGLKDSIARFKEYRASHKKQFEEYMKTNSDSNEITKFVNILDEMFRPDGSVSLVDALRWQGRDGNSQIKVIIALIHGDNPNELIKMPELDDAEMTVTAWGIHRGTFGAINDMLPALMKAGADLHHPSVTRAIEYHMLNDARRFESVYRTLNVLRNLRGEPPLPKREPMV